MQLEKHNSSEHLWHNQLIVNANDLRYHCDWNWIMEVVEKIEKLDVTTNGFWIYRNVVTIDNAYIIINRSSNPVQNKKEAVYKAVISFIDWHNENKNNNINEN